MRVPDEVHHLFHVGDHVSGNLRVVVRVVGVVVLRHPWGREHFRKPPLVPVYVGCATLYLSRLGVNIEEDRGMVRLRVCSTGPPNAR